MPTDIERINAALAKGWRPCCGEPEELFDRYKPTLEAALPVLARVSEVVCIRCDSPQRDHSPPRYACAHEQARAVLARIADILEGKLKALVELYEERGEHIAEITALRSSYEKCNAYIDEHGLAHQEGELFVDIFAREIARLNYLAVKSRLVAVLGE